MSDAQYLTGKSRALGTADEGSSVVEESVGFTDVLPTNQSMWEGFQSLVSEEVGVVWRTVKPVWSDRLSEKKAKSYMYIYMEMKLGNMALNS